MDQLVALQLFVSHSPVSLQISKPHIMYYKSFKMNTLGSHADVLALNTII